MDRALMLHREVEPSPVPDNKFGWSMITGYSNQHFSVKKIFQKHWNILKNDKVLGAVLPDRPVMIYRGAPSL